MNKSIIFCGVGGDGIITASNICANALLRANFDVKKSEVHGMSQRGGSVNAFLIYGKKVYSLLPAKASVDYMFASEKLEALRSVDYMNEASIALINDRIVPIVGAKIDQDEINQYLNSFPFEQNIINFNEVAKLHNMQKGVNTIMLGYFSKIIEIDKKHFTRAIADTLNPKLIDINIEAFEIGLNLS
ncbi:Indolepyruvate oxidoreductase subunit IorB [Desulfurella amilsii]|uniref:Indolepyruvate oxidoreductase subunit IorB n=1 Tax=Desulfurella amilsii TaxID=1562698 RepID=A0A1X4XUB3_9BACT|nr:indolepyruvate oxidoreductase subunit beta [Desulfurella amilsii]OSS41127.1 Indolepyruvate oxidoreductase subunit IorB [Desulfurella amilsii]